MLSASRPPIVALAGPRKGSTLVRTKPQHPQPRFAGPVSVDELLAASSPSGRHRSRRDQARPSPGGARRRPHGHAEHRRPPGAHQLGGSTTCAGPCGSPPPRSSCSPTLAGGARSRAGRGRGNLVLHLTTPVRVVRYVLLVERDGAARGHRGCRCAMTTRGWPGRTVRWRCRTRRRATTTVPGRRCGARGHRSRG